jgi:hypothetical protein
VYARIVEQGKDTMKLCDLIRRLELEDLTPELADRHQVDITRGYASDLLSDILANAPAGGFAVTVQAHMNTVAVALHARLAVVILASSRRPDPQVIERAVEEKIPLVLSREGTFDVCGKLWDLGLRGGRA